MIYSVIMKTQKNTKQSFLSMFLVLDQSIKFFFSAIADNLKDL